MDSNYIKVAVNKINSIIETKDYNFATTECSTLTISLLTGLILHFERAPLTAAALIQHITNAGFNMSKLKGETYSQFMKVFGPRMSQFTKQEVLQLSKIAKKLISH